MAVKPVHNLFAQNDERLNDLETVTAGSTTVNIANS